MIAFLVSDASRCICSISSLYLYTCICTVYNPHAQCINSSLTYYVLHEPYSTILRQRQTTFTHMYNTHVYTCIGLVCPHRNFVSCVVYSMCYIDMLLNTDLHRDTCVHVYVHVHLYMACTVNRNER